METGNGDSSGSDLFTSDSEEEPDEQEQGLRKIAYSTFSRAVAEAKKGKKTDA